LVFFAGVKLDHYRIPADLDVLQQDPSIPSVSVTNDTPSGGQLVY
jgi:hypothetical protein